eukprot:10771200-Lingulodinium_polyedra.AAC.1
MLTDSASDPMDGIAQGGGMTGLWLMDDQTIFCDPRIVPEVLKTVDEKIKMFERGGGTQQSQNARQLLRNGR